MKFLNKNRILISKEDLNYLEIKIGNNLPIDYRTFLLDYNGGKTSNCSYNIKSINSRVIVDYFLGLNIGELDLNKWIKELSDDMGNNYLPIAFDSDANLFILEFSSGCIYYWDSGRHINQSSDAENTYIAANSFTEFINSLQPFD